MSNKYTIKAAKYEAMSEVVEYLERKISEAESDLEREKNRLAEATEDSYKSYYVERIDEYADMVAAYKTVQSLFIESFD